MEEDNKTEVKELKVAEAIEKKAEKEIVGKAVEEVKSEVEKKVVREEKVEKKEVKVDSKFKKNEAVVHGRNLRISKKQSVAICGFIRGKNVDEAIDMVEDVVKMKRAVPMRGEIPHRKGKGMMSGRYPVKAGGVFVKLLKSLKSNAIVNELELEKYKIFCRTDPASRPYKSGRRRMKRAHVEIKLIGVGK